MNNSFSNFLEFSEFYKTSDKNIVFVLNKYYNIGNTTAKDICVKLGFNSFSKFSEISETDWDMLKKYIESHIYKKNNHLSDVQRNISYYISSNVVRGSNHQNFLPVRGQRTKTNAQTRKAKRIGRIKNSFRKI